MPLGLVGSGGGSGEKEPPRPAKVESRQCVKCDALGEVRFGLN